VLTRRVLAKFGGSRMTDGDGSFDGAPATDDNDEEENVTYRPPSFNSLRGEEEVDAALLLTCSSGLKAVHGDGGL
jgi:hypothetical protein